jgi:hypothetical protein
MIFMVGDANNLLLLDGTDDGLEKVCDSSFFVNGVVMYSKMF